MKIDIIRSTILIICCLISRIHWLFSRIPPAALPWFRSSSSIDGSALCTWPTMTHIVCVRSGCSSGTWALLPVSCSLGLATVSSNPTPSLFYRFALGSFAYLHWLYSQFLNCYRFLQSRRLRIAWYPYLWSKRLSRIRLLTWPANPLSIFAIITP